MDIRHIYNVAGHLFSIVMPQDSFLSDRMKMSYGPFAVGAENEDGCIFSLKVSDEACAEGASLVYSNSDTVERGFVKMDVFKTPQGHYIELTQPESQVVNAKLSITDDFRQASLVLDGHTVERWLAFNTAVDFCFLLSTASKGTLLTHASSVVYKGRAYMFLGKSGTGKSTHSRMWQTALKDVVLMNDDHPVIRVDDDGNVTAYGSPWSGKTPCYKNMSAPLGGVIRISRAPHNRAVRLAPVQAYASFMTSCSGMTWDEQQAHGRDRTMQAVIRSVPFWTMECLPDEDAARVCSEAVTEVWEAKS